MKKGTVVRLARGIFQACVIILITWILLEGSSFLTIFILSKSQEPAQSLDDDTLNYRKFVQNFHPLFRRWSENQPAFLRKGFYVSTRTGFRQRANTTYSANLVTDSEGFICNATCEPLPYQKPLNEYRIFIFGGSVVAGYGVENGSETISGHLEHLLAASDLFPNRHVRVVNAGVPGHFSGQDAVTLVYRIMSFQPDMILVYDGYNDFLNFLFLYFDPAAATYRNLLERNLSWYDYQLMSGFDKVQTISGSFSQFLDVTNREFPALYYTLHLAKIVSFLMSSGGNGLTGRQSPQPSDEQINKWVASPEQNSALTYLANVDTIAAVARGKGIPAVLCLQPSLSFTPNGHPLKDTLAGPERTAVEAPWHREREFSLYFDYILAGFRERIAANSGDIRYCDMTGLFEHVADQTFVDSVHLALKGDELVAKRFLAEIEQVLRPRSAAQRAQQ